MRPASPAVERGLADFDFFQGAFENLLPELPDVLLDLAEAPLADGLVDVLADFFAVAFAGVFFVVFTDVTLDAFCPLLPVVVPFAFLLMSLRNLFTSKHPRRA